MITPGTGAPPRRLILVVEDDREAGNVFREILEHHDYAVHLVANSEDALEDLERDVPLGMVIDLHLATMEAPALLRRVRADARFAALPAAVVTGDYLVDEATAQDLASLGARLYFKPIWGVDILQFVSTFAA